MSSGDLLTAAPQPEEARRRPTPWSLSARLTAWYFVSSFGLVLISTGILYETLVNGLLHQNDEMLMNKLHVLRSLLQVEHQNSGLIAQEVGEDTDAPRRIYARVLSANGTVLHESRGITAELNPSVLPVPADPGEDMTQPATIGTAVGRKRFRILSARLVSPASSSHAEMVVQIAADISDDEALLAEYRQMLIGVLGAALLACAAVGYQLARAGLRPLRRIARASREIGTTTLDRRIDLGGLPAELSDLAITFNDMLNRLEASFIQLRRFSDDIAHELRTPINNMLVGTEVALGKARTIDEYRDVLESHLEDGARLSRIVQSLLFLARSENPQTKIDCETIDIARELALIRDFYEAAASDAGISLSIDVDPIDLSASADRILFQRAISNLVANAVAYTSPGGHVRVRARGQGETVTVEVIDTGSGIAPEHLPHVFERFYRVERNRSAEGGHLGLGLSIVKRIAALHGGSVAIESEMNAGTRVRLDLPKISQEVSYQ